ncbi:G-protein coupled receptor [Gaeumannomyces tritici R3-111a-1]|uniref:G-protein coupled receptor n=1 Tax=Gaeumannomyces tritici (strain R3-111a-1) TaxID=644352 RepID=J3PAJ0_GAET3|nr:G-protein coupled receptor [Gaeumannomyces tritici R3-111a-1]EJT71256.1 G-protein coupled receptor [Gaeumannomyces tritici R3-111a-1]
MSSPEDIRRNQLDQFSIIERVCSVFSLLGCVFIIATFCARRSFHKPINRLVFYASFGNMMSNVGTLMARTFVDDSTSPGCQFQAFLIQMFLPADTFWTLAMAVNVYLTFYHKFDAAKLRRMELPYLCICYGVPFIVALTYIFINSPRRGRMYGDATLWCWISPKWDIWRITTFYAPIWVIILITFFIYIRAGGEIYRKHKQLRNFQSSSNNRDPEPLPPMDDPYLANKTTEIFVTSEVASNTPGSIDLSPLGRRPPAAAVLPPNNAPPAGAYSVTISSRARMSVGEDDMSIKPADVLPIAHQRPVTSSATAAGGAPGGSPLGARRKTSHEANNAAWSYTKCAILFFTAMLVTWIPSSANRVYSVIHVNEMNLTLEYMSAFVLPLQGFWNAVIYVVTSWSACTLLWHDLFLSRRPVTELIGQGGVRVSSYQPGSASQNRRQTMGAAAAGDFGSARRPSAAMAAGGSSRPHAGYDKGYDKNYETESMTELTGRPSTTEPPLERKPHNAL